MVDLDIVKSMTDLCDGGAHITPSHCSVMEACRQRLEDVDRNHTMM